MNHSKLRQTDDDESDRDGSTIFANNSVTMTKIEADRNDEKASSVGVLTFTITNAV
jgi:hypothetical protein